MNTLSFMTANYVARQLDYNMTEGWMQGDRATNDYFRPLETYAQRLEAMLGEIQALGFTAIDLWLAHLHFSWAAAEHIAIARTLLQSFGFSVSSLAGGFGATRAEFEAVCRMAAELHAPVLGGNTALLQNDRASMVDILADHGLVFGLENHPEKNAAEILAKIGDGAEGRIGVCLDTGWFGTYGYDAAQAIAEIGSHLAHVHLKDVLAAGSHETCRYGRGCVPIQACVAALRRTGYAGGISIEHEPEHYNPNEDCRANLLMVQGWLADGEW
jgi:sugar phosphate isomerase/epimerase